VYHEGTRAGEVPVSVCLCITLDMCFSKLVTNKVPYSLFRECCLKTTRHSTIKKNTDALFDARKEVCLDITIEKTKYILPSHHQYASQKQYMETANRAFENVARF
jgi:hypothetical protein